MTSEAENVQCPDCGATVRPGASFCFKCGKHFGEAGAGNTPVDTADSTEETGAVAATEAPDFNETIADIDPAVAPENSENVTNDTEATEESPAKPVEIKAKPPLTTAASMRRKPKPQREKIEMVWEQPEGSSNPIFVVGTVVIFILVLVILIFVYVLK